MEKSEWCNVFFISFCFSDTPPKLSFIWLTSNSIFIFSQLAIFVKSTTAVLVASNALISLVRKITPDRVRIPIYIVIVASFVTLIEFIIKAYFPSLYESLGIYIPLIVVNCIIFGRAEAFAGKNNVIRGIIVTNNVF